MKSVKKYFRVDRREICFLRSIIEAYEGIATITTIDPHMGLVEFCISPGCEVDVEMVLQDLKNEMLIKPTTTNGQYFDEH